MLVAITGGSGFVGRRLVEAHLERGDRVRLLSRRRNADLEEMACIVRADITDPEADLRPFVENADILYHCAGELTDERRMHAVHVAGTRRLIKAATGQIGRWVQLSSVGAYGPRRNGIVSENAREMPVGTYERTKTENDVLVATAAASGAFEHVLLRPSIIYGPGMPNQSLFQLISMIERGLFFYIGPPGAVVNYVHVQDVVSALMNCAIRAEARGQTYILSDNCSLEEAIRVIALALERPMPSLRVPHGVALLAARIFGCIPRFPLTESRVRALTQRVVYDGSRIERDLGYRHQLTLECGFREMAQWWRNRR